MKALPRAPRRGNGASPGVAFVVVQRASRAPHIPPDATVRKWMRAALANTARVTVRYVGEAEGRRLNREFRGKDHATNVLSFAYEEKPLAGDIVICAPVVAREAAAQGKAIAAHHAHLLIHGALHLQGYDHEGSAHAAAAMEKRERAILAKLGFPDPY
jgi:probable rRNA maturation factor